MHLQDFGLHFAAICASIYLMGNGLVREAFLIELPSGAFVRHAVTDKESAKKVECPTCGAEPDSPCTESNGTTVRKALHVDRHTRAISQGARVRFIGRARVFYEDETDQAA